VRPGGATVPKAAAQPMLFNSVAFIFGFLPLVLLGFFLLARSSHAVAVGWLTLASLFFYGWWNPAWLPLLLASMAFNFGVGQVMARAPASPLRRRWLWLGIAVNLALLLHYKYADFLQEALLLVLGVGPSGARAGLPEIPLGISFFTFTQIAFLVDVFQRKAADFNPVRYGLFVTYYPHLIAGPILHHREMMPQFQRPEIFRCNPAWLAAGLTIFVLGLFKKTVLADRFASLAHNTFAAAEAGTAPIRFFEAWGAALAYTLQLYFDFSGYSDMAIGLALMIGVQLPLNFHSPYKARNITEFWRRWHMTLSRFLRDYLYIPLGGNRRGPLRRYGNLMLTMLLGGLWHGAGWTFLIWGALHGLLLVLHGLWRSVLGQLPLSSIGGRVPRPLLQIGAQGLGLMGWLLTFTSVVVGWVFFRAADLPAALAVLQGMAGLNGAQLPDQIVSAVPALGHVAQGVGKVVLLADGTVMGAVELTLMLAGGLAIVTLCPAMHELQPRTRTWLLVPCAALALQQVLYGRASPFLYFQF
jgi:alginate O-acetyltransferase complex protein AlgI